MSNEGKNAGQAVAPKAAAPSKPKFNLQQFLKEVRQEFTRISWPTRPQVIRESLIVLLVVVIITLLVFLFDVLFNILFNFLIK